MRRAARRGAVATLGLGSAVFLAAYAAAQPTIPPPDLKIAFIGDQGVSSDAEAVLQLIAAEGAHAVIHAGDLGYNRKPNVWEAQIDAIGSARGAREVAQRQLAWSLGRPEGEAFAQALKERPLEKPAISGVLVWLPVKPSS